MCIKHFILNISNVSEKHSSEGELHEWFSEGREAGPQHFPSTFPGPMLPHCALNKRRPERIFYIRVGKGKEAFFVLHQNREYNWGT